MKTIIFLLIALVPQLAMAGPCERISRACNEAATVNFYLLDPDGIDFKEDAAHASGDTVIMKDEGTPTNTTNGFVDEGDSYSLALTQAEMNASRITVSIKDQGTKAWLDSCLIIETYGTACGQHDTTVSAVSQSTLAQFVTDDTGETSAVTNSVADLSAGTGGAGDWTSGEKEQIRFRLAIDGNSDAPDGPFVAGEGVLIGERRD